MAASDGDNQLKIGDLVQKLGIVIIDEAKKEKQELIELKNTINKRLEMIEARINKLCKIVELNLPLIKWTIDKSDEKRMKLEGFNDAGFIESKYFTGMIDDYKLQLKFWVNGYRENENIENDYCTVYLCVYPGSYSGAKDQFLRWPFTADVTIKVTNKANPNKNKTITKYCKIEKPTSSYESETRKDLNRDLSGIKGLTSKEVPDNIFDQSESFDYFYRDLAENGEKPNSIIVECIVHFN